MSFNNSDQGMGKLMVLMVDYFVKFRALDNYLIAWNSSSCNLTDRVIIKTDILGNYSKIFVFLNVFCSLSFFKDRN